MFVGYLDRDGDLEDCYSAGDAFVFASRTETQGLVLLEAMALGVPVVSTVAMGTREVLGEGRGSLIAEEDEQVFADLCIRVLTDTELRQSLAREARAHAQSWSAPALAARMIDFYRDVLESGSAGRGAAGPVGASGASEGHRTEGVRMGARGRPEAGIASTNSSPRAEPVGDWPSSRPGPVPWDPGAGCLMSAILSPHRKPSEEGGFHPDASGCRRTVTIRS